MGYNNSSLLFNEKSGESTAPCFLAPIIYEFRDSEIEEARLPVSSLLVATGKNSSASILYHLFLDTADIFILSFLEFSLVSTLTGFTYVSSYSEQKCISSYTLTIKIFST